MSLTVGKESVKDRKRRQEGGEEPVQRAVRGRTSREELILTEAARVGGSKGDVRRKSKSKGTDSEPEEENKI